MVSVMRRLHYLIYADRQFRRDITMRTARGVWRYSPRRDCYTSAVNAIFDRVDDASEVVRRACICEDNISLGTDDRAREYPLEINSILFGRATGN